MGVIEGDTRSLDYSSCGMRIAEEYALSKTSLSSRVWPSWNPFAAFGQQCRLQSQLCFFDDVFLCVIEFVNVLDILFAAFRASSGFLKPLGAHLTLDPKLRTFCGPLPAVNQQVEYRDKFSR